MERQYTCSVLPDLRPRTLPEWEELLASRHGACSFFLSQLLELYLEEV